MKASSQTGTLLALCNEMNRFTRCLTPPKWEGIIFLGLDRSDERLHVYEAKPRGELAKYIEAVWYMTWQIPLGTELTCLVAPNPCAKLCTGFTLHGSSAPREDFFVGPKNSGSVMSYAGSGSLMGIDFKPGGLFPFIGPDFSSWHGQRIFSEKYLSGFPKAPQSDRPLHEVSSWLIEIENYFEARLSNNFENHIHEINHCIDLILNSSESLSLETLSEQVSLSKRTLQRIFKNEVAVSAKDVLRIGRFNKTIRSIGSTEASNLADIAIESGFFDQPHMLNEFKKLSGARPTEFKKYW